MGDLDRCESLHSVRMLRELVRQWFGVPVMLAGQDGVPVELGGVRPGAAAQARPVTAAPNAVCGLVLSTSEGLASCHQSYRAPRERGRDPQAGVSTHRCHLGFEIVAVPFRSHEAVAGYLVVSGLAPGPLDPEGPDALALLERVRGLDPKVNGIEPLIAGLPSTEASRRALLSPLLETVAADVSRFLTERARASTPPVPPRFDGIIGSSPAMVALFRLLEKIVASESTVLVLGESGTGKELVARAIHERGPRKNKAFVAQNCSAITETLLESAMFGYIRGAFTGAVKDTKGLFEVADGGTFFLDEIGDMSPSLQVKLLRVLQDGTFTPVGGTSERRVNVRVIAATNKDLATAVQRGEFREDLYYRLNVIRMMVPPLRDRAGDIGQLVDFFLDQHNRTGRHKPVRLSRAVRQALEEYTWPGNVRELENEIERLTVLGADEDEIDVELLSPRLAELTSGRQSQPLLLRAGAPGTLKQALEDLERQMIRDGLQRTGGNKSQLAKELGISRSNLIAKVQQYGLEKE